MSTREYAVISGASSGIGAATARALADNGFHVIAAAKIYEGVEKPLVAEDVAEAIRWVVMLPDHFNVDSMMIKPLAQAVSHKIYRKPIR